MFDIDLSFLKFIFQAFCVLGGSLVSEGATLLVAINSIKKGAAEKGLTFTEYGMYL